MKWKIYFLLFGSLLSLGIFTTSTKNAHAIESYKISQEDDRTLNRGFHSTSGIRDNKNIDLHYYFYADNNYSENLKVIAYICEYKTDYYNDNSVISIPDCGLSMVQEAGKFKIKIKAGYYSLLNYSRRTQKIITTYFNYQNIGNSENYEVISFTDQDFERGLTLLGGTTLKVNNWNRNEGGFLLDPVGGSSNNSNSSSNSSNNGGGFDILGGIKSFFQPMIDSITRTQKAVLGISDNIINGIKGLFTGLIDLVKNIWDFLSNFFVKLFEELGKFVNSIFVPSESDLNNELSNIKSMFNFDKISTILNATFLPLENSGFRYGNSCSNNYWDASTEELRSTIFSKGGDKYSKGWRWSTSICSVPQIYIMLARSLIIFAFIWWSAHRLFEFVPILMGSAFIWDKWKKRED